MANLAGKQPAPIAVNGSTAETKAALKKKRREKKAAKQATVEQALTHGKKNSGMKKKQLRKNFYLMCLLDCLTYGPVRFPDKYAHKTSCFIQKFSADIPICKGGDTPGKFYLRIAPTLYNHVTWEIDPSPSTTKVYTANTRYPAQGDIGAGQVPQKLEATFGNLVYPPHFTLSTDSKIKIPLLGDGKIVLPSPQTASTVVNVGILNDWFDNNLVAANWQLVDDVGTPYTPVGGVATCTNLNTKYVVIQIKSPSAPAFLKDFSATVSVAQPATTANVGATIREANNVTDYDELVSTSSGTPLVEKYRIVAMQALVTYMGNDFQNGGRIAGTLIRGGTDPDDANLVDVATISSSNDAVDLPVRTGMYAVWTPSEERDMAWRDPTEGDDDFELPTLVIAGTTELQVAGGVATGEYPIIRLQVGMCVEATTHRTLLPIEYSPIDPYQIQAAQQALQGFPMITENPLHVADIKNAFKKVASVGHEIYNKISPMIPIAMNVAKALGPLMALL